jgi:L-alanine-DL-glutamate epimerase-like enolase superfamily enzyme
LAHTRRGSPSEKIHPASIWVGHRSLAVRAISGIDMALSDIKGNALTAGVRAGRPRPPPEIPTYASALMPETPAAVTDEVRHRRAEGCGAIGLSWEPFGIDLGVDVGLVRAASETAEPGMKIMTDLQFYPGPICGLAGTQRGSLSSPGG